MPQLKTLFLSSISQFITQYKHLKIDKSSFSLQYLKTNTLISLDEIFEHWCTLKKEERETFLKQYFETFLLTLEQSQFSEEFNDDVKNSVLVRLRHVNTLGNNPFVSKVVEVLNKNLEHTDIGLRLVCETISNETKNAMLLFQKKWCETMNISEDKVLSAGIMNLNQKFKNERNWTKCNVSFPDNPDVNSEYFYLSDFKDVYTCSRVVLFPDLVLPQEVILEARNGISSWVLISLGDDLVALVKSTYRWSLLQISQFLIEKLEKPSSSQIIQMKPLCLLSSSNLLQWKLYSPNFKIGEGIAPRSKLEFDAIKNGLTIELKKNKEILKDNEE